MPRAVVFQTTFIMLSASVLWALALHGHELQHLLSLFCIFRVPKCQRRACGCMYGAQWLAGAAGLFNTLWFGFKKWSIQITLMLQRVCPFFFFLSSFSADSSRCHSNLWSATANQPGPGLSGNGRGGVSQSVTALPPPWLSSRGVQLYAAERREAWSTAEPRASGGEEMLNKNAPASAFCVSIQANPR